MMRRTHKGKLWKDPATGKEKYVGAFHNIGPAPWKFYKYKEDGSYCRCVILKEVKRVWLERVLRNYDHRYKIKAYCGDITKEQLDKEIENEKRYTTKKRQQ